MRITVHVKPNARKEGVEKISETEYRVSVNAPAREGRANEAVIAAVAKHWKIRKSAVTLVMGEKSKTKVLEVACSSSIRPKG